jgi:CBS domain containing-hemolysin-like protein
MDMSKGPTNAAEAQAACYFRVLINVALVIVVNEVVPKSLAKDKPYQGGKTDADANSQ